MGSLHKGQYTVNPAAYLQCRGQRMARNCVFADDIPPGFRVVVEGLAKGTAAKINLAHHTPSRLVSALKVFKHAKRREADVELRVLNTGPASPFLLHCYDAFMYQGCRCLVLQYAPFGSLDDLTRTFKGLGFETMRLYAMEIAQSLEFLHSHKIIHRDVKPENMLILSSGHVVLADFNIAFQTTDDAPMTSQMCGTYLTRPPEVGVWSLWAERTHDTSLVWEFRPYNQSLDIWMYGVSLYNIASNKWPFLHARRHKHAEAIRSGIVKFSGSFFSPALVDLIHQTLQVDSSRRILTADILHHEYFNGVTQSQNVPLSPSQLMSLLVNKSPVEMEIIRDILHDTDTPIEQT